MATEELAALVLAAGQGTRMRSRLPKVLHKIAGRPMLQWVLDAADAVNPAHSLVVVSPANRTAIADAVPNIAVAEQTEARGTGHAVQSAMADIPDTAKTVMVLFGDTPLLRRETLQRLVGAVTADASVDMATLGFHAAIPTGYGRLIVDSDGDLEAIVEEKSTNGEQKKITLCNGGVMVFRQAVLQTHISNLSPNADTGEYYLTDLVPMVRRQGQRAVIVEGLESEVMGVNSRVELAAAEKVIQSRLRRAAMENGVTMVDPDSVFLSHDTVFGRDVTIEPNVIFGPGVSIADNVEIFGHSHLVGCTVAAGARIGPYARLRPQAEIGEDARVGNFVEIKAATLEAGAKANHLSYIGDARVGAAANIGAGTITCNYDGFNKHRTEIGRETFIGSNSALVAPVSIGDCANIAAGSVITEDVPDGALAVARGRQATKPDRATALRANLKAIRESKK